MSVAPTSGDASGADAATMRVPDSAMNHVIITIDDMGDEFTPWARHASPQPRQPFMPFLAGLVAGSTVYDRFYMQPACSTYRAALWTSKLPLANDVGSVIAEGDPPYELACPTPTWVRSISDASDGPGAVLVGKHHLSNKPAAYAHPWMVGFNVFSGTVQNVSDYFSYTWHRVSPHTGANGFTDARGVYHAARVRDAATDLIEQSPRVLCVSTQHAHAPFHVVPDHWCSTQDDGSGDVVRYIRACEAVDEICSAIFIAMSHSQRARTVWWIAADNGSPAEVSAAPKGGGKGTTAEGGTNGTLVRYDPRDHGIVTPRRDDRLVSVCDIGQTIVDMMGVSSNPMVYGRSLLGAPREYVAAQKFDVNGAPWAAKFVACAVHRDGWKLRVKKLPREPVVEDWYLVDGGHSEDEVDRSAVPTDVVEGLRMECFKEE